MKHQMKHKLVELRYDEDDMLECLYRAKPGRREYCFWPWFLSRTELADSFQRAERIHAKIAVMPPLFSGHIDNMRRRLAFLDVFQDIDVEAAHSKFPITYTPAAHIDYDQIEFMVATVMFARGFNNVKIVWR